MTQKKFDPNDFLQDCGFNQDEIQKEHVDALNEAFKSLENDSVPEINKPNESQLNHIISLAKEQKLFNHTSMEEVKNIRQKNNPINSFFLRPIPNYTLVFMTLFGLVIGYQISNVLTVITDNNIARTDLDENTVSDFDIVEKIIASNSVDSKESNIYLKAKRKIIPGNDHRQLIKKLIEKKIDFEYKVNDESSHIIFVHSNTTLTIVEELNIDYVVENKIIRVKLMI